MTDKQIIIDVSKCKECGLRNCEGNLIYWCHTYDDHCKDFDSCYYKQLKRKEQECEELKKEAVNLKLNLKKVINLSQKKNRQCYQFLADIKQLKRQRQSDKGLITSTGKMNYQLIQEYDKLKQTLTEIKPILELYANSKIGEEQPDGTYKLSGGIWDSFGFCTTTYDPRPAKQGLQKISECEVE